MKPAYSILLVLVSALTTACASGPHQSSSWGTASGRNRAHLSRSGSCAMQSFKRAVRIDNTGEADWKDLIDQIHLFHPKTALMQSGTFDPVFSVIFLVLPDGDVHQRALARLGTYRLHFGQTSQRADDFVRAGNRFGAFLHYAAAACMTTDARNRQLCLSLARQYCDTFTSPLVSAAASAIMRNLLLLFRLE